MALSAFSIEVVNCSAINVPTALLIPFISPIRRILVDIGHLSLLVLKQNLNVSLAFDAFVELVREEFIISVVKSV